MRAPHIERAGKHAKKRDENGEESRGCGSIGDAAGERFFASFDVLRDGAFFDAPPFVVVGFAFKRGRGDGSFARTSRRERRVVVFVVPPPPASRVAPLVDDELIRER